MKSIEQSVARHYTHGSLEDEILRALTSAGKDINRLETADLAPVDEFHIGGRQATIDFAGHLGASRGMHLLDIGCGLGGASRYFAHALDCRVSGIDLTEEYVRVVGSLARWVGLGDRVSYRAGGALSLPFASGTFDGAYMLHVGMNIAEKAALFTETRRVPWSRQSRARLMAARNSQSLASCSRAMLRALRYSSSAASVCPCRSSS
jgi:SAM-dependent methyltransferase